MRPLPAPRLPPCSPLFPQTRPSPQALPTRLPPRSPRSSPGRTGRGHAAQTDCGSNYSRSEQQAPEIRKPGHTPSSPVVHQSVDMWGRGRGGGCCGHGSSAFAHSHGALDLPTTSPLVLKPCSQRSWHAARSRVFSIPSPDIAFMTVLCYGQKSVSPKLTVLTSPQVTV